MLKTASLIKNISVVILAAGFGMRLKNDKPKALVDLDGGKTILDHAVDKLSKFVPTDNIIVVVGYKKELVMEQHPELTFVYNEAYNRNNTGKSLLRALKKIVTGDVLWLNGDVVFDERLIAKIINKARTTDKSCILVDNKRCGDEEVKYATNENGEISFISKDAKNLNGEALGINLILEKDIPTFLKHLDLIDEGDYFEKAIENMIGQDGAKFFPVNTNGLFCEEVDFPTDLETIKAYLKAFSKKIAVPR